MSKVTIEDVAKKAGVSVGTVSRAMNNGICKATTKQKVMQAIKDLHYVPNQSARNLGSVNFKKRIAILLPDFEFNVYHEFMAGAKDITSLYGFDYKLYLYQNEKQYLNYCDAINASSEYLGVVEFGPKFMMKDKLVINVFDQLFKINQKNEIVENNIYLDLGNDNNLNKYFQEVIYKNKQIVNNNQNAQAIIVCNIEQACYWVNQQTNAKIYVLEPCLYASKLLPINELKIDFYAIGVLLLRYTIKLVLDQDLDKNITITI